MANRQSGGTCPISLAALDRVRFVTRHFRALNGVQRAFFAQYIAWVYWTGKLPVDWFLVLLITAPASCLLVLSHRYYAARFGYVEPPTRNPLGPRAQRAVALLALGLWLTVVVGSLLSVKLPPVSAVLGDALLARLPLLLAAAAALGTWTLRERHPCQFYHLALGILLLAACALPSPEIQLLTQPAPGLPLAIYLLLSVLLDHRLLVRTLKPLARESLAVQDDAALAEAKD